MNIPVNKGDLINGEIIDISHEGKGVVKLEGFTIFTEGGTLGDKVNIKILNVKKKYAIGKTIEIVEPSKYRVKEICSISDICGGCQLQGLDYKKQLELKNNIVLNSLKRISELENVNIRDIIGMDNPYNYRNNVQIPVGLDNGKTAIGFYKRGSHEIADIQNCSIQHHIANEVVKVMREYVEEFNVEPYDTKTGRGLLRHIIVRNSFKTEDAMVVLVINGKKIPNESQLIEKLKDRIPKLKSVILNFNTKKTNLVMGPKSKTIFGSKRIVDYIGDLEFHLSAESFFQVNPVQTEILYNSALKYADLNGTETVFDIYCGIGTISLFLSQQAKRVYGIESVPQAVKDAKENAKINEIDNVEFHAGKAEELLPKLYEEGIKADVVVVDPPRKGCEPEVLDTIIKMKPQRVVYVSCNPSTLARDLKILSENGFEVSEVQPVDMFPHTMHVECVTLMSRVEK